MARTVFKITPTGGSEHDYNNGSTTFVRDGIVLPKKEMQSDAVRSYTGRIRQVDIHCDLLTATIPMEFRCSSADELDDLIIQLETDLTTGGTMVYQEGGDSLGVQYTYQLAVSSMCDVPRDKLFRNRHVALFTINPIVAPW